MDCLNDTSNDSSVFNLGISGDTTRDLLKRFKVECEARNPEIIVLAIGNNDSSFRKSLNEKYVNILEYENNLTELIKQGRDYTKKIIIIGLTRVIEQEVTPVAWEDGIFYYDKDIAEYGLVLKKVARENDLLFISMDDVLEDSDFEDGLHPNSEGHRKMFERVKGFMIDNKVFE